MKERPRVLIEDWLPVSELGIESRRERAAANALPGLSYLHVWWARRPIVASTAVVAASLLPAWGQDVEALVTAHLATLSDGDRGLLLNPRAALRPRRPYAAPTEGWYHDWLLRLAGIMGDPAAGKSAVDAAKAAGLRVKHADLYGYLQAFHYPPTNADKRLLETLLVATWGEVPIVLDPTAGGGTIPFAAARLGLGAYANDLNGVAATVTFAGVGLPITHGSELRALVERWGNELVGRISARLSDYYSPRPNEAVSAYIYANTVRCPRTGKPVPLVPDWRLRTGGSRAVGIRMLTSRDGESLDTPAFELVEGVKAESLSSGTLVRGDAISPYDHLAISGDYIKSEAQSGRMGYQLYALATRSPTDGRGFRSPDERDLLALRRAEDEFDRMAPKWLSEGILPTEAIPEGNKTAEPLRYGLTHWTDLFTKRQLLAHCTFTEMFRQIEIEVRAKLAAPLATGVLALLALMQGKAVNYNGRLASWHVPKQGLRSVFERHDLAFKWTFAEFDGPPLYDWALKQLLKSFNEIVDMVDDGDQWAAPQVTVTQGNAASLRLSDRSVHTVCIDPPYYDNVMYAELADYFYVWEKRTLRSVLPEYFTDDLSDKDNEAVANIARFASMGKRRQALADADYEAKMTAIFTEANRVLKDDGTLTVMFTHKRAEAWDTLGMALLDAGFAVETSWPVRTESEHSLHQAKQNSAESTIMLVCRKRSAQGGKPQTFFEDIEGDVRRAAREAVDRFAQAGLTGVDLLLSTYGPALSVISSAWPVYSSHASPDGSTRLLRPEETLDAARAEVVRLQRSRLVGRPSNLDALTDFVLIAWDTFKAHEFPFDDARRLALAVGGLDMEELKRARILAAKSGTVRLMEPRERVRRDDSDLPGVRPSASSFSSVIDAVHTIMYVADVDGLPAAKALLDRQGLTKDAGFLGCVQGLMNAIPRVRVKGEWTAPEAGVLDLLVGAYLSDTVSAPSVVDLLATEHERLF